MALSYCLTKERKLQHVRSSKRQLGIYGGTADCKTTLSCHVIIIPNINTKCKIDTENRKQRKQHNSKPISAFASPAACQSSKIEEKKTGFQISTL